MKAFLFCALFLLVSVSRSEGVQVDTILAEVKATDRTSITKAEDALVKLGKAKIGRLKSALAKADRMQKVALGGAILRLSWGMNPQEKLNTWLTKNGNPSAFPELLTENALLDVAPNCAFYSLHFAEWPVMRMGPPPFKSRNIIAVPRTGDVKLFTDPRKLADLFGTQVGSITKQEMPMVTAAWLRLSAEFSQDGYFAFRYPMDQIRVHSGTVGFVAVGKATVDPKGGDKGEIVATLNFIPNRNRELDLKGITEKRTVQAGVRPICQALLLLDPNPIVRRMAERDLLVMGPIIKPYLDERRNEASPELQEAIDRIWQRILRGER